MKNSLLDKYKMDVTKQMTSAEDFEGEKIIDIGGYKVLLNKGIPYKCEVPKTFEETRAMADLFIAMRSSKSLLINMFQEYALNNKQTINST